MDREDVIRMAREAGISVQENNSFADDMYISVLYRFATLVAAAELEKVAQWMLARSYATGHGDTIEDLLEELVAQVADRERESIAKMFDDEVWAYDYREIAAAIRARGTNEN